MTIMMPARFGNDFRGYGTSAGISAGSDHAHIRDQQVSAARQALANFALLWARSEPALVAQHHREWLS
jgi:hypothetical protein